MLETLRFLTLLLARWSAAGAAALVVAFAIWLVVVQQVNNQVAHALAADPNAGPAIWTHLRGKWKYGHAAGFVAQLGGFSVLLISVLVDDATPAS